MQARCLWQDTASQPYDAARLNESASCDVAIVGGGFTGLRAAIELANKGASVMVLEAANIGSGASGLNGGQVNPMLPHSLPSDLRGKVEAFWANRIISAALKSADLLFEFIRETGIDCNARQDGWLRPQHSEKKRKVAIEAMAAWNEYGAGLDIIDRAEISLLTGSNAYVGGTVVPNGGAVQPLSLLFGMAIYAEKLGVRIHSGSRVTSLRQKDDGWHLEAANNSIHSDAVVVATNGYTDGLVPGLKDSVLPIYSIQIATDQIDPEVAETILPKGHTLSDTRRVLFYARKEPDNRMVIGSAGISGLISGLGGFDWLERALRKLFPQIGNIPVVYRWGGKVARTEDQLPHIHEIDRGLFAGLGFNGRGVALSSLMGANLAKKILGADDRDLDFPISPMSPYKNRSFKKFGSGLAIRGLRLLDELEVRS